MSEKYLLNQIAASMIPGAGSIIVRKLIGITGSPEALFSESKKNLLKIPQIPRHVVDNIFKKEFWSAAEQELDFIINENISTTFYQDKNFPVRLNECYDAPVLLYFKGNIDFNRRKIVSIVGTRKSSHYGSGMVEKIIKGLAESDSETCVVSGLAYGIDIMAHKAALRHNLDSLAVLAHGLDDLYPPKHKDTADKMMEHGGLITEYTQSTIPESHNFVKRNRIVAGLSDVTLVIESGLKGGAMITANLAFSYNREVMAVPGNVGNYFSAGCNFLIKTQKAAVIESADDLLKLMNWDLKDKKKSVQKRLFTELKPDEEKIYLLLQQHRTLSLNDISLHSELMISQVSMALLNMELEGIIKSLPGNMFTIA
ncbi:DNA-processing protein DprA [Saccharicrinis sp. FJH54]|uniref:DNA-processing protein DprA n=1 Tax=Saccharicrinis sp. FJH54 TaxID=3344665 RepID=UPI0035D44CFC